MYFASLCRAIAGCSAVLAVRRYCGYRSLVCGFTSRCAQKKQVEQKKRKRKRRKEKNSSRIGPEKIVFSSAMED